MTNTEVITIKAIDETLAQPVYSFLRLPSVDIEVSKAVQQALDEFQSVDNAAGRDAARWLQQCALPEYETSRTTLLLGHGRIAGFHSLASQHVEMDSDERGLIGLRADRARVPATLTTWIAKDPRTGASGKELFLHARRQRQEGDRISGLSDPRARRLRQ